MCVWGSNVGRRRGVRSRSRRDGDGQDWHMCLTCLVFIYVSMCPILPFDLSATQINQSYEIWPQDGKASEIFYSLTISLMCFFPVFNPEMMAVT